MRSELHVVTGAFGYSGKYIAERLLAQGFRVRTLTNSPHRANPFQGKVEVHPLSFYNHSTLVDSLRGAKVLYNTYWVRFDYGGFNHSLAVENTKKLFNAAVEAGVPRIVHASITNPSVDSSLPYFKGKAELERALQTSGISYSILRPAVLFGKEDILINNIAWVLRRFPIFGLFGDGQYRMQPIYVDDFADLAVEQGLSNANRIIDAIGPETFTYRGLVETISSIIGRKKPIISLPPSIGFITGWFIGKFAGDVTITREEIEGLMQNLLFTSSPPVGKTKLTDWARASADTLGIKYASELARRKNTIKNYQEL